MKVIVASQNPVKLASAVRAFTKYFADETIEFVAVEADSGVSDQPLSIEETIQGAVNRAKRVCQPDADYSVGIEGGMSFYTIDGREQGIEIGWVCVHDCRNDVMEVASVMGYSVFPRILKHIRDGRNLSEAVEAEYGIKDIGQKNGYIGWLSNNVITRESSYVEPIFLALSSLMKEEQP